MYYKTNYLCVTLLTINHYEKMSTSQSIGFGGDASIQATTAPNPVTRVTYDYQILGGKGTIQKTIWHGNKRVAWFDMVIPANFDELIEQFNTKAVTTDEFAAAACSYAQWADDFEFNGQKPVWIRISFDNGNPYSLAVTPDAEVCESCDIVLGNYSKEEIFEAFRNKFKREFEQHGLSELVAVKSDGAYMRWDVRTAFFCDLIKAIATFDGLTETEIDNSPETEWTVFANDWNFISLVRKDNEAPYPKNSESWDEIYDELSN